jgi:hypothetical protein
VVELILPKFVEHSGLDAVTFQTIVCVHMRRPLKLTKHQQREVLARLDRGETLTEIARSYAISHMTISRIKAQYAAA